MTAATSLRARASALVALVATRRHRTLGLAVVRVALGCVVLADLLIHASRRHVLWGPDGWYGTDRMERDLQVGVSLFRLDGSALTTDLLYLAYAAAAVAFTIGWRTTWVTPVLLVLVWTFQERNPYLINGGDNLLRIILLYLVFARLDAWLSPGAARRRATPRKVGAAREVLGTVAHNTALAACIAQLCIMYGASALYKAQGEMWFEGTAVYYITRVAEYDVWPEVTRLLFTSATIVTVATYTALLAQLAFPFTVLTRRARHVVFVLLAGMHAGIGLLMGLPIFSAVMIACDLLLLTDTEWRTGARRVAVAGRRLRRHLAAAGSMGTASHEPLLDPEPTPTRREAIP